MWYWIYYRDFSRGTKGHFCPPLKFILPPLNYASMIKLILIWLKFCPPLFLKDCICPPWIYFLEKSLCYKCISTALILRRGNIWLVFNKYMYVHYHKGECSNKNTFQSFKDTGQTFKCIETLFCIDNYNYKIQFCMLVVTKFPSWGG